MSQQLQELIHRSSHIAFYSGVSAERQRIIKLLEDFYDGNLWRQTGNDTYVGFDITEIIELVKG